MTRHSSAQLTLHSPLERTLPPTLSESEREALRTGASQSLHTARNATKACVTLVEWPPHSGERVVLKDGSCRAWWFRVTAGRWQMKREWNALCFLRGMEGVPCPKFCVGPDAFGMEWLAGESLLKLAPDELPASAVQQLEAIVHELHTRGVTHGDLHCNNILYDAANDLVYITDWATACLFGPTRRGFKSWMWREWQALDLRAIAKVKARYASHLLREDEHALLTCGGTPLCRTVRKVGSLFKSRKRRRAGASPIPSPRPSL